MQELAIFCPDPNAPNDFVELTVPGNTTAVPTTNTSSFTSLINSLKTSASANKVVLTNLFQVVSVSNSATPVRPVERGAVRGHAHAVGRELDVVPKRHDHVEQPRLAARDVQLGRRPAASLGAQRNRPGSGRELDRTKCRGRDGDPVSRFGVS